MSRSRRKTNLMPWTCAESEKKDKRIANRKLRRKNRESIRQGKYDDVLEIREVSNRFHWDKDGLQRFDKAKHPEWRRK